MGAEREHELEVPAVARHAAVELALVADPDIHRPKLPADAEAREERALLLRRRDDVEDMNGRVPGGGKLRNNAHIEHMCRVDPQGRLL